MAKQCQVCHYPFQVKVDFLNQQLKYGVKNGAIRAYNTVKGISMGGDVYIPANFCPECGRDLKEKGNLNVSRG